MHEKKILTHERLFKCFPYTHFSCYSNNNFQYITCTCWSFNKLKYQYTRMIKKDENCNKCFFNLKIVHKGHSCKPTTNTILFNNGVTL